MTGYVYMMSNRPRGAIYIGVTSDLQGRAYEHRTGNGSTFTHRYRCYSLVWFEQHPNIVLAIAREKAIKEYRRDWKINLIEGLNPAWDDLYDRCYEIENVHVPHPNTRKFGHYAHLADPGHRARDDDGESLN